MGHVISKDGIKPNPDKISAIQNYPLPKTPTEIKRFLGLLGYYRKFIPDFAKVTKPMTQCLKKGLKITLDQNYIQCFEKCKTLLMNDPILKYPDFTKEFISEFIFNNRCVEFSHRGSIIARPYWFR